MSGEIDAMIKNRMTRSSPLTIESSLPFSFVLLLLSHPHFVCYGPYTMDTQQFLTYYPTTLWRTLVSLVFAFLPLIETVANSNEGGEQQFRMSNSLIQ